MKEKILRFFAENYLIWAYWLIAVVIELTAVAVTGGTFYIRKPWIFLSMLLIFGAVSYTIKSQSGRFWYSFVLLLAQAAIDIVFIVIYEMTDTIFDFSMLHLRSDAMAIIESLPINFVFVLISGLLISAYVIFGRYFRHRVPQPKKMHKVATAITAAAMACMLVLHGGLAYFSQRSYDASNLQTKLSRDNTSSYIDKGILGNFLDELYKGAFFSKVELGDTEELGRFVYAQTSSGDGIAFGAAEGYNIVTVLGESFEWFAFRKSFPESDELFAGGFGDVDEKVLREVYPNLYKLYDESVVMTDFHAREKTDISENLSIMGAYPTDYYINYDYPKNTVVTSLPRTLKALGKIDTANAFHNGTSTFYNRDTYMTQGLDFDSFTASDKMIGAHMTDYISKGERNLDSEMIDACHAEMFPDERFYTYITTITQHGQYEERDNLRKYYEKLDRLGLAPLPSPRDKRYDMVRYFRTYAAAAMELDAAIGRIDAYLTERNAKQNTILVLFGDHNAYYSSLSSDVKGIADGKYDVEGVRYTDLFRVPLMIRVGDGSAISDGTLPHFVDKFTCTADIVPTLYELLGVRTYDNLLYGHSVFDERESVLYSRAYDIFMTDKLYFSSLHKIRYRAADADETYMEQVTATASKLLEKVSHTNRIFYYDYLSGEKASEYYAKLRTLNEPQT